MCGVIDGVIGGLWCVVYSYLYIGLDLFDFREDDCDGYINEERYNIQHFR